MKIAVASDHAGFKHKTKIAKWLKEEGHEVKDFGCHSADSIDYPDFAFPAASSVAGGESEFGVIICGSGIGVSIVANKVKGIRAASCCTVGMSKLSRQHNDANVITFGERLVDIALAKEMVRVFLSTEFEGGRHSERVDKIHSLTGK